MKERGTSTLCLLIIFCYAFIPGEILSSSPTLNLHVPSTSPPPHSFSTTESESLTHLNASANDSRAASDLSNKSVLNQSHNSTTDMTQAPAPTESTGTTADSVLPVNNTNAPGNLTDSQDDSKLSPGDTQTIYTHLPNTTNTIPTTPVPKPNTEMNTSGSGESTKISATTTVDTSASSLVVTTPNRSSTAVPRGTTGPTMPTTSTIQTTEQNNLESSTPVVGKTHADFSSELNVGDDGEHSSSSMDPLLAGLVSVFVVTAAAISLLIFLKFRHRNEQPEFRRLQDLPMDDIMEDTPLSMYNY